jgi:PAS domain S-box-containing protein
MALFASPPRRFAQLALALLAVYVAVAGAYIAVSDRLLVGIAGRDFEMAVSLQTLKGLVFVVATGIILFLLVWRLSLASWRAARAEAEQRVSQLESEALFRHDPDAVLVLADGVCVAANRAAGELLACPAQQLIGHRLADFGVDRTPDDSGPAEPTEAGRGGSGEGAVSRHRWRFRRSDGREGDAEVTLASLPSEPRRVVAWIRDATERIRAERLRDVAFRLSEAAAVARSAAELYPTIHSIVGELMPAGNFYIAVYDPASDRISFPYFVDEQDPTPAPKRPDRGLTEYVLRTGEPLLASPEVFEELVQRGEVDLIGAPSIDWLGVPLKTAGRTVGALVVQTYTEGVRYGVRERDLLMLVSAHVAQVLERTRAQEQLLVTEQKLRDIVEHSSNLFYTHGPDHVLTYVSPQTRQFVDCEPEEALIRWTEFATDNPVNRDGFESTQRAIRTGQAQPVFELELVGRKGRRIWVEVNEAPVVRDGAVVAMVGALTDITARRQAEIERSRLATAIEQAGESVILTDPDGTIEYVNPAFSRTSGFTRAEVIGTNLRFLEGGGRRPTQFQDMLGTLRQGAVWSGRAMKRRRDGSFYQVESSVAPVYNTAGEIIQFVAVERDITQEVELETQLRQAQKVEAVGKLAGGLAHDFNNLLQALLSTVQVLQASATSAERVRSLATELEAHVRRGASLTRQLLIFARRDITRTESVDLNDVVRDASELLRRLIRENIRVETGLHAHPLLVEADRSQLEQVLVNLVLNASEAMPSGGQLALRTGQDNDGGAWFEVADTGVGMPEEVRDRIFEPFFTTKLGKGTGLGLSVVHNIVRRHGGTVNVTTGEGRGSSFRVTLPARPLGLPSEALWLESSPEPPAGRGERVLLVEDEGGARDGLTDMLTMLGYSVTAAASGEQAEALAGDGPFDALLTDLMLPGLSGVELAGRLVGRWPGLRVLLMSGYAEDEALRQSASIGSLRYLQKPFDMSTLARELRAALDGLALGPPGPTT